MRCAGYHGRVCFAKAVEIGGYIGHVGYGSGIHMGVGQLVARLEGEAILAALARKVGSIEISGPVQRRYNNTLRGLESLPVTIRPA